MATVSNSVQGNSAPETAAEAQGFVARARWMMLISAVTTAVAIAAVIGVIGYRVFGAAGRLTAVPPIPATPVDGLVTLPKGARVVSTAVAARRIVVTLEVGGASEIRIFDLQTLRQIGRLQFATEP